MTFKIGDRVVLVDPPEHLGIPIWASGTVSLIKTYKPGPSLYIKWDNKEYNKRAAAKGGLYDFRFALETEVSHLYSTLFTLEELTEYELL